MNYRSIDSSHIRVSLTQWELETFKLDFETLGSHSDDTRRLLIEILRDAHDHFGFDPGESALMVEAYPSGDGGCTLCLSVGDGLSSEAEGPSPSVFAFDNMEHLLEACSRLFALYGHRIFSSSLYAVDTGYQLVVFPLDGRDSVTLPLLSEYGRLVGNGPLCAAYAEEHGRVIVERNAIDTLSAYLS